jgi:hypothetical protein
MTKDEALKNIATVNAMNYEYQAWAREALAQPEHCSDCGQKLGDANHIHTCSPQSMHPQLKKMLEDYFDKCFVESATQRLWVGLTDEEMQAVVNAQPLVSNINVYFKAIEAKLKEKNT